jgi:hypothetical protein
MTGRFVSNPKEKQMPAKKTAPKAKKAPMKKVGAKKSAAKKKPAPTNTIGATLAKILKEERQLQAKKKRVYWDSLTPQQQAKHIKDRERAKAKARRDIGGPNPYTVLRTTSDGWRICAANHPLDLRITQQCIDNAVCGSKKECVVAQAIHRQVWNASDWMVGTNITIITCEPLKMVIKYGTSAALARAIPKFDSKEGWNIEPGLVRLNPLPVGYRLGNRWMFIKDQGKGTGGKASTFNGTAKAPTRSGTYYQAIKKAV